ncbi:carbohydrate sulfotransferase 1-like isoform X2 [Mercenaria mercenaria]|uniref:carbohydrate sulfotransferase 1-like isoform X2 n=1 Tax=Mercenaria mercenaria TaxID=6596 RepID=UPI00234E380D|nr:carbohydrate sulfotransferase 1-like isoform X2 [Mercenaria mercenaria]
MRKFWNTVPLQRYKSTWSRVKTLFVLLLFLLTLYKVAVYTILKTASSDTLVLAANISSDRRLILVKNSQEVSANAAVSLPATTKITTKVPEVPVKYDIVINSYMRSGSSFMGQLLAFRPDSFYWYEPLWNYDSGVYYWGKDYVCTGHSNCGYARNRHLNMDTMHKALYNIYTCDFSTLVPAVAEQMTPSYSGSVWKPYQACRAQGQTVSTCLKKMEAICKTAKHRTTKIVRLTVDNLEYVLENLPNVKVVHLMRDPRAIINSRITTNWYNLQESPHDNHQRIRSDAKDLCLRMKYDLKVGTVLKQKFPGRFAFVMFEDLQTDMKSKTGILYSYFGIDKSTVESKLANMTGILQNEHLVNRTWGDYTNWWRHQLSFGAIKAIDSVCKNVSDTLGYTIFSSESQLKDVSLKAFSFREELLLENLHKSTLYNFNFV